MVYLEAASVEALEVVLVLALEGDSEILSQLYNPHYHSRKIVQFQTKLYPTHLHPQVSRSVFGLIRFVVPPHGLVVYLPPNSPL